MEKTFCDHCGKEISGIQINEIICEDCFFDVDSINRPPQSWCYVEQEG